MLGEKGQPLESRGKSLPIENASFEPLYSSLRRGGYEYSLVRVPLDLPILMRYKRASEALDLCLMPVAPSAIYHWRVTGFVDVDTVANLGLPVASRRVRSTPPTVTEIELHAIAEYGDVEAVDAELWRVDLELQAAHVYRFLTAVWRPRKSPEHSEDPVGWIHLGDAGNRQRHLPEKRDFHGGRRRSTLHVERAGASANPPSLPKSR